MKPTLLLFFALVCLPLVAEVKITNPGLADRESLAYTETIGTDARPYTVTLGRSADGRIEVKNKGFWLESTYRLDPVTLLSLSSETLTRAADATVRRTADYSALKPVPGPDDLVVTDLGSLAVVLRGFDWGQRTKAQLLFVGNSNFGGGGFSLELEVTGRQTVQAAGRSWDCWRVTTGLSGAFSMFLSKTEWWFAVEGTHPLVKSSGPSGGPGSLTRTLILTAYQPQG